MMMFWSGKPAAWSGAASTMASMSATNRQTAWDLIGSLPELAKQTDALVDITDASVVNR
jgi:hypothetical protein